MLAHFENIKKYSSLTRKQTYHKLAQYLEVDDYESLKADEKLGEHFVDRVQFAVKNGKKFLETIPSDDMRCSPYTNLGWIVNEIYLSK